MITTFCNVKLGKIFSYKGKSYVKIKPYVPFSSHEVNAKCITLGTPRFFNSNAEVVVTSITDVFFY